MDVTSIAPSFQPASLSYRDLIPPRFRDRWEKIIVEAGSVLGTFVSRLLLRMGRRKEFIAEFEQESGPGSFSVTECTLFMTAFVPGKTDLATLQVVETNVVRLAYDLFGEVGFTRGLVPAAMPSDCFPALRKFIHEGKYAEFSFSGDIFKCIERHLTIVAQRCLVPESFSDHIDDATNTVQKNDDTKMYISMFVPPDPSQPLTAPDCNQILFYASSPHRAIRKVCQSPLKPK